MVAAFCLAAGIAAAATQNARQVLAQPPPLLVVAEKTLQERVSAVHAAVLVRALGPAQSRAVDISASLQRGSGAPIERPVVMTVTESDVVVVEAFKAGGLAAGATIRIGTIGGQAKWGDKDVVIRRRTPDLQKGATYVVLLRREPDWNQALMFRDDEVFKVEGGLVTALPHAGSPEFAKELAGLREVDALENLRKAARRPPD